MSAMTTNACRIGLHAPSGVRFRSCHVPDESTRNKLFEWHVVAGGGNSFRTLARGYGYPDSYATTLSSVLRGVPGCITLAGENVLRKHMGMQPLPVQGEQPVMVAPPKRPAGKSAWTGERKQRREAGGWRQAQVIEAGLSALEWEEDTSGN